MRFVWERKNATPTCNVCITFEDLNLLSVVYPMQIICILKERREKRVLDMIKWEKNLTVLNLTFKYFSKVFHALSRVAALLVSLLFSFIGIIINHSPFIME